MVALHDAWVGCHVRTLPLPGVTGVPMAKWEELRTAQGSEMPIRRSQDIPTAFQDASSGRRDGRTTQSPATMRPIVYSWGSGPGSGLVHPQLPRRIYSFISRWNTPQLYPIHLITAHMHGWTGHWL